MKLRVVVIFSLLAGLWSTPALALRVCADSNYLPYSNRAGEGFENKIAEAVAKALGEKVEYTWASQRAHGGFPQFLSTTLDARKCDVIMSLPYGSREELTTRPYYISSYAFIFDKTKKLDITSFDSPALKRLKIGFEHDTPVEDGLKIRGMIPGNVVGFEIGEDSAESPETMLKALKSGQIDVLITWQPAVSSFLRAYPELEIVTIPSSRALGAAEQYTFPMSMGVRLGDTELKKKLDDIIDKQQAALASILTESGVTIFRQR